MNWIVRYRNTKRIEKTVAKLRPATRRAFAEAIRNLAEQGPKPFGWHVKELKGNYLGFMSMRLDYRHRMIYSIFEKMLTIEIIEVTTREGAYS